MNIFAKSIAWLIAFPLTFILFSVIAAFDYLLTLFDMPYDVWKTIDESDAEQYYNETYSK